MGERTKTMIISDSNQGYPIFNIKGPTKDRYGRKIVRTVATKYGSLKKPVKVFTDPTTKKATGALTVVQIGDYVVEFSKMPADKGILVQSHFNKIVDIDHDGRGSSILSLEPTPIDKLTCKPENIELLEDLAKATFEDNIPRLFRTKEE